MVASFFIAFITTMVPRIRPPPPPDVRDDSRVSCLLCFQERPARDSTAEHGPASTMDGDSVGRRLPGSYGGVCRLFFSFVGSFGFPPGHHASKQHTDSDKNGGVLGVLFFFSLSVWVPASTMDSG